VLQRKNKYGILSKCLKQGCWLTRRKGEVGKIFSMRVTTNWWLTQMKSDSILDIVAVRESIRNFHQQPTIGCWQQRTKHDIL